MKSILHKTGLIALLLFAAQAHAATRTWNGNGTDNNWTTSANWDVLPIAGDDLVFPTVGTRLSPNNNFAALTSFASITVSGSGYTIGGNSVTLTGSLQGTLTSGSSAVGLVVAGGAVPGVKMNGVGGTLVLSGTNTFTGGVTIQAGTLSGNTSTNVFGTAGNITIGHTSGSDNATLLVGTSMTITRPVVLATGTTGTLSSR